MKSLKGIFKRLPILCSVILCVVAGCNNEECYENKNSLPLAGFYASDSTGQAIGIDSLVIYGVGAPGDSLLQDNVRGLSQTYLPFRIDRDSTVYVFKYSQQSLARHGIADTIVFDYELKPWFESAGCGVIYRYEMRSITTTHHIIDSVVCPLGVIDNVNQENLKIYFRTE